MVSDSFKEFIRKHGPFYAPLAICPLDYHGYKCTHYTVNHVIEEIKYELSIHPEHCDALLDQINNLKSKLKQTNNGTE